MGDVIHALPVVADLRRHFPQAEIDWVVEEAFAELVHMQAGVRRVLPIALRRWKKNGFSWQHWRELSAFLRNLRSQRYDAIFDLQGLGKSALVAGLAYGPSYGFNAQAAKEPWSARLLSHPLPIKLQSAMIEQLRSVPAQALGYAVTGLPEFNLQAVVAQQDLPESFPPMAGPFAILLPNTAANYKLWPEADWQQLAQSLSQHGVVPVFSWGNEVERMRVTRIVDGVPGAVIAPRRYGLREWARIMLNARVVIGLDTGLAHLAAALRVPSLFLFGATPHWRIAPYWYERRSGLPQHLTLGRPEAELASGQSAWPTVQEVLAGLADLQVLPAFLQTTATRFPPEIAPKIGMLPVHP